MCITHRCGGVFTNIPNGFFWTYISRCLLSPLCMFALGLSGINFKYCIILHNGYSPGCSAGYNYILPPSLPLSLSPSLPFSLSPSLPHQNKETNNQTVEQGALVAEEEVILSSAFCLAVISFYSPVYLIHFLVYSAILIPPLLPLSQREEKKRVLIRGFNQCLRVRDMNLNGLVWRENTHMDTVEQHFVNHTSAATDQSSPPPVDFI